MSLVAPVLLIQQQLTGSGTQMKEGEVPDSVISQQFGAVKPLQRSSGRIIPVPLEFLLAVSVAQMES